MIHPTDADEQRIGAREVIAPHDRILGERPPRIARGPALSRDEIDVGVENPAGNLRIEPPVRRSLGRFGAVEGERITNDEKMRHRHRMSVRTRSEYAARSSPTELWVDSALAGLNPPEVRILDRPLLADVQTAHPVGCAVRGAEGTRTPDPLHAMQVRYQLRHSPGNLRETKS